MKKDPANDWVIVEPKTAPGWRFRVSLARPQLRFEFEPYSYTLKWEIPEPVISPEEKVSPVPVKKVRAAHGLAHVSEFVPAVVRPEILEPVLVDDDVSSKDLGYTHPVFVQCFLPNKHNDKNKERWQVDCGRTSLVLRAGELAKPDNPHEFEQRVVPAGPKARFVVAYVNDYIQRKNTQTVNMGRSMREAMEEMGIPVCGTNGDALKNEAKNFAAADVGITTWDGNGKVEHRGGRVAPRLKFWLEKNPNQGTIWQPELTVSAEYFKAIRDGDRLAPFHWPTLIALQHDTRAMDIHCWLVYRLRKPLSRNVPLHVDALHAMFGRDITSRRKFWDVFRDSLAVALKRYPAARVEVKNDCIILKDSPPFIPHKKLHHLGHIEPG